MEAQYQGALAQVGIGHEGAREQEEYNCWAKKRAAEQAKTARERGRVAIRCGHSRFFLFKIPFTVDHVSLVVYSSWSVKGTFELSKNPFSRLDQIMMHKSPNT